MTGTIIMIVEKKKYNMTFRCDGGFLESRQCSHFSAWEAEYEAKLYAAWAEYHYGCEVFFEIKEQ